MREEELVKQLIALISEMEMDEKIVRKKFNEEYQRVRKFQKSFLGTGKIEAPEQAFDPKIYTTHILTEGTVEEKRELLGSLKNKLILRDRKISLEKTNN
jgi:hypothetical protein